MSEPRFTQRGDSVADYNYTVYFEPLEKGGYQVIVPAFPEICTFGDTLEEARAMAKDAIQRAGFCIHHSTGSHARLFHRVKRELRVTIPLHNKGYWFSLPERPNSFIDHKIELSN